ncbi:MAG TPA: GNAT family N-acetyltransferase [Egibacteraceae bacterium]|nr:GNAT family N-acetyltransferase [Egibacteraceae bacterium]
MTVRSISASQTRRLRQAILRPGQAWADTAYPGDPDASTLHVGAFAGDALVGVASVYAEAPPGQQDPAAWQLRGMATVPAVRGQGHGAALLRAVVGHVARMGGVRLWCNARTPATGFYARHGFASRGEEFVIDGIGPHVVMERAVAPADERLGLPPDPAAQRVETPRLLLRRWRTADLEAFASVNADAETMRTVGSGRPLTAEESARALEGLVGHWEVHGFGLWAVEERATGRLIGRAGLWHPPDWPDLEIGWLIARDQWGRGFATEAARAGLAYGFAQRRADRVGSIIRPGNVASERVATRVGMRSAGDTTWRGNPVRTYTITRAEWDATAHAGGEGTLPLPERRLPGGNPPGPRRV